MSKPSCQSGPRAGHCRNSYGAAGFTLLEILVVLVVLGTLILGLTQGLHLGMQAWDGQRRALDAMAELDATDRTLRGLIEQMEPGRRVDMPDIAGTDRTLRFTTRMPAPGGPREQRSEVMLLVDREHRLLVRWAPSPHVEPLVRVSPVDTVLLDGVDHMQISYKSPALAAPWQSDWQSPVPPLLVRIRIVFAPTDPRHWPDFVAMPMRELAGG
jgi:general secretion pathway protein J